MLAIPQAGLGWCSTRQPSLELRDATGNARFYRAQRQLEDFGDFLVRIVLEITQRDRGTERFFELRQRLQHRRRVRAFPGLGSDARHFLIHLADFAVLEADEPPAFLQELTVQRGEQPSLHFRAVPQLMALPRPDVKCLLGQVARLRFVMGQAEREGKPWLYLDVGVFNGLMESIGGIRYPMEAMGTGLPISYTIAGPSCDSVDVIATDVELPRMEVGDRVIIHSAGAYTTAYASPFNGYPIPETIVG